MEKPTRLSETDKLVQQAVALTAQGRQDEAIVALRRSLSLKWLNPEAHYQLGLVLSSGGSFSEAAESQRTALSQRPDLSAARVELGRALLALGQRDIAIDELREALKLNPTCAGAYYYLGNALQEAGHLDEAAAAFRTATILEPNSPDAHYNLGMALMAKGELEAAVNAYQGALKARPLYAEAFNNMGNCLQLLGRLDEAVMAFRKATLIRPKNPDIHGNLGNALKDVGRLDEALACYDRAAAIQPDYELWGSHRLYVLHFMAGVEPEVLLAEHLEWDRRYGQPLKQFIRPHPNNPTAGRRVRIGYVSADFREHVVGRNLLPLFREHDREMFEIACYYNFSKEDHLTARFRSHADRWLSISGIGDEQVAQQIRADQVDILVDLSLHMGGDRLAVFARKPAPVQATFAGYPSGTGLEAMGYRLTDPYLDPPANDGFYRERSLRLADSFWCFDPSGTEPSVAPLPALSAGQVTFGCLNNFCKVNDSVLRLWASVMREVPNSRLLLLAPQGASRQRVLNVLARQGIEESRVQFADRQPRDDYLRQYAGIDIALDTFPYNGHTTTLEGLWMGVPVVTKVGRLAVSRAGFSQLSNLALAELAAHSDEQFVQVASSVARDLPRLAQLRSTLRDRMRHSPLTDATQFARGIEHAYRTMLAAKQA